MTTSSRFIPACLLMSALLAAPAPAHAAGRGRVSLARNLSRVPVLNWFFPKQSPHLVEVDALNREMSVEIPNKFVWAAFGKNDAKGDANDLSKQMGRAIARKDFVLMTGGGKGLPKQAETGAYFAGGSTFAFSPANNFTEHTELHKGDVYQTTHFIGTRTGGGSGTIAREAPMAQSANGGVASFANGGPGTAGELFATLHNDSGVLAFLKGTGGVADSAAGWLKWLGAKDTFKSVAESDPQKLVAAAKATVDGLPRLESRLLLRTDSGRKYVSLEGPTKTLSLVSPGAAIKIFSKEELKDRVVGAFLSDDARMSEVDADKTQELLTGWTKMRTGFASLSTVVTPDGSFSRKLAGSAAVAGTRAMVVSAERTGADKFKTSGLVLPKFVAPKLNMTEVFLGYGEQEMGKFAAAREVSQDADVLFFASAHYQNMSALAYALRDDRKPVIAILENESTHADKILEMISVIEPKALSRVVTSKSPAELLTKVAAKLETRHTENLAEAQKKSLD